MLRKLISGGMLKSLAVIITAGIALFSMPILIHNLGDHNYSLYSLVASIIGLCTLIDLGFNRAFSQSLATAYGKQDTDSLDTVISVGLVMNLVLMVLLLLIVGFIAATGSWWVAELSDKSLFVSVLLITGISSAMRLPTRMAGEILRNLIRYDLLVSGALVESVVRVGCSIWAVTHGYGLIAVATISLVTVFLENLWEFLCVKRVFPTIKFTTRHFTVEYTKELFRYSVATFLSDTSIKMKAQCLPLIIVNLVSLNALVFMVVAQRLIDYCSLLIGSWSEMLTPLFGQLHGNNNQRQLETILTKGSAILTLGVSYLGLCLVIYSGPFIEIWLGPNYRQSADILSILAFPLCVGSVLSLSKEYLFGIGKIHGLIILHILELVVLLLLCFPLGYYYGLLGITWAMVISTVPLEIVGVIYLVSRTISCSWTTIYGESLLIFLKFSIVAIITYILIHSHLQLSVMSIITYNIIQGVCSIPFLWLLLPGSIKFKLKEKLL